MSDLLNSASLVMIPSGYKEDVVYSQIPTDGSGDLSFTRASNGTRVNSAGLVEVCPWNAMQYSEDFANAVWGIPNGGSSVVVTSNATTAPNGTTTADKIEIANGTNDRIEQVSTAPILTSGLSCTFSVYIKSISGTGKVGIRSGQSGASSVLSYTNEWQRLTWTFNALGTYEIPQFCNNTLVFGADSAPTFYAWGAQLNIGSTAKPYFPTTDRLNVPRLTYQNGGGGCPSLLLEKQSTNVLTYSEDFSNAVYTKRNSTIGSNVTTSPDGTTNADKIQEDTSNDRHDIYADFSCTSGVTYTQTIFAKQGERRYCFLSFGSSTINTGNAYFDLQDGIVVSIPSGVTSAIQNMGNGWFRCSITATASASGIAYYVNGPAITGSNFIYQGVSGYGIYIYGAQIEASSYPTSYIPTTTSSATRVADACFKTGISSLIGQTEGTVFVDLNFNGEIFGLTNNYYIYIGNGLNTNAIYIDQYNNSFRWVVFDGTTLRFYTDVAMTTGRHKLALAYKNNDYSAYLDGTLITTQTLVSGAVPTCSQFSLIGNVSNFDNNVKQINQAVLFKTRLTNAELASITSL